MVKNSTTGPMLWRIVRLIRDAAVDWHADECSRWAASLAFYSVLSLAPLLIIAISIAGTVFGDEAARGEVIEQMRGYVGETGAAAIQEMLVHAKRPGAGTLASLLGLGVVLFGASGVFSELRFALNRVWNIQPPTQSGLWQAIRSRLMALCMVLATGVLLVGSVALTTFLSGTEGYINESLPLASTAFDFVVSLFVMTLVFALIFRYVPDSAITWKDVWVGAMITAALFTLGKYLLALYLGRGTLASAYGAAGSIVVLIVWIYYSAQVLFFGAEITQVYARDFGSGLRREQVSDSPKNASL
jgi:membrane protein